MLLSEDAGLEEIERAGKAESTCFVLNVTGFKSILSSSTVIAYNIFSILNHWQIHLYRVST